MQPSPAKFPARAVTAPGGRGGCCTNVHESPWSWQRSIPRTIARGGQPWERGKTRSTLSMVFLNLTHGTFSPRPGRPEAGTLVAEPSANSFQDTNSVKFSVVRITIRQRWSIVLRPYGAARLKKRHPSNMQSNLHEGRGGIWKPARRTS